MNLVTTIYLKFQLKKFLKTLNPKNNKTKINKIKK